MGSQTFRTSLTCRTCLTRPRTHPDSCSFASFVNIRGLKTSIEFPLSPSHKALQSAHKRERANNPILLRVDFLIASASTIRMSADRIRKPADTIRKLMDRIRRFFTKSNRKSVKNPRNLHFPQDFPQFFPPAKSKTPQIFWQKAPPKEFLHLLEGKPLSIFQKV